MTGDRTQVQLPGNFLACGIGSLPHLDPQAALELIVATLPQIPHWPQLPRRGHVEHFLYQSLVPLVKLGLIQEPPGATAYFATDSPDWAEKLTAFYTLFLRAAEGEGEALAAFAIPPEAGVGFYAFKGWLEEGGAGGARFLKGQVAGPLTAGLYLTDAAGHYAFYEPQLRDLIVKTTALQARWQARVLGSFGLPVMIFVDDPAASAYGSSAHVALGREAVVEALAAVAEEIEKEGGIPGAHSCSGVEWPIFFEAGFRVVSFDAYNYFTSLQVFPREVDEFLAGGGILAWGIVPTYEGAWQETGSSLRDRLQGCLEEMVRRGVDRERLYRQGLVTPSCGTGTLAEPLAKHIYRLTAEVAANMQQIV
ncbi:hypothetical protein [Thermanaeromonas sp. C210]|uniref:hypothetical protein n=1 Tax=Thermanaeromonas sp. C210 TaxID=2731925 RepID=UPI00155CC330|nr:hypothetical protein [Thermanaeromonas sp. C210]GFN24086.1 hypothetical protein TAMC210_24040 [Thermanaeromonas sp. C210]